MMKMLMSYKWLCMIMVICGSCARVIFAQDTSPEGPVLRQSIVTCKVPRSRCFNQRITCPKQCPVRQSKTDKACYINCESPQCTGECRYRKPNCQGTGAACFDPRFVGADGAVFYFHGKSNEHFTLVSDKSLHINAHFIGHRPTGRPRDYTWIQALGVLFGTHSLSVEATKASTWDSNIDHLRFTFDDNEVVLPQGDLSSWKSEHGDVSFERVSDTNSVVVNIPGIVEIGVNAVPITKEEDRVHNYQIPSDDCFSHLEVQFRFFGLSDEVDGVLGQTYRPGYESRGRLGNGMAVVGGEDKFRTTALFAADCKRCVFLGEKTEETEPMLGKFKHGMMDCSGKLSGGNGIVCKK